jgi:hypothetical protein
MLQIKDKTTEKAILNINIDTIPIILFHIYLNHKS